MSILNYRMLGAPNAPTAIAPHGRSYQGGAGVILTVPYPDGDRMLANGYVVIALSGPTASRPATKLGIFTNRHGTLFWDETLAKLIVSDGVNWRDPSNGNIV